MPFVIDRRSFLKSSLGAVALSAAGRRLAVADADATTRWALLSDIHIAADPGDTIAAFIRVRI